MVWLVIGIAIYGITVAFSDVGKMQTALAQVGIFGWLAVIGLSSLNIGIRFVRWQYYLQTLGHSVPVFRSLEYFIAGFAFTSTPAKAGEALRSLYLKREGVAYTDSLAALFVERLTDLIAVVLLALAAAYQFEDYLDEVRKEFPNMEISTYQSNIEGEIIDKIQQAKLQSANL